MNIFINYIQNDKADKEKHILFQKRNTGKINNFIPEDYLIHSIHEIKIRRWRGGGGEE